MPDRTPRFMYSNLFQAQGTVITALSEDPSFPKAYLRYDSPSSPYQSLPGYNVKAGYNNKIDFNKGGVLAATIPDGNYPTPVLYALAWQNAMNAVSSGFTVAYDPNTTRITVSNAATFTLLFGTGANFIASAGPDAGFNATDHTPGAVSWTGENNTFHTREFLQFDFGVDSLVQAVAIYTHNMRTTGTLRLASGSLPGVNLWDGPYTTILGDDPSRIRIGFPSITVRYVMLIVDDVGNRDGYSSIGISFGGPYWEPGRAFAEGSSTKHDRLSAIQRSYTGALFRAVQKAPDRKKLLWRRLSRADRIIYQTMEKSTTGRHVFIAQDPLNYPGSETLFGMLDGSATITEFVGDGQPSVRYNIDTDFIEDLG